MKRLKKRLMKKVLLMVSVIFAASIWFGGKSIAANLPERWQGMQTVGDAAMLTIRVEFKDIKFTDGIYTEAQLTAMIDGTDSGNEFPNVQLGPYDSLNGYYKRSSYGKLSIRTKKDTNTGAPAVYSYTLSGNREEYAGENGGDKLVKEVLDGLNDQIDYSDYDLNNDGIIDGICINFAGQNEGRDSIWWSHVGWYQNQGTADSWDGKSANCYMFFHTQIDAESGVVNITDDEGHRTLVHETGHMLGLDDYYNFDDADKGIQTQDMMCYNSGEHNGFSKWLLGWITDDQIQWITKDSVDEEGSDVTLSAVSTEVAGASEKLIAVITPDKEEQDAIYSEYFVVEYDKDGVGNYKGETGFRVFHVDAHLDENGYDFANKNGYGSGNRLIYAVALVDEYELRDEYFTTGESLTPDTVESTAFYGGNSIGFTGISLTDFNVQADENKAAFHVAFEEKEEINGTLNLQPNKELIGNMGRVTLRSDKPLTDNINLTEEAYFIDASGEKYPVSVMLSYADAYQVEVVYIDFQEKPLQPDTEYTLVIPAGRFQMDTDVYSEECQLTLHTDTFAVIKKNFTYGYEEHDVAISELFGMDDQVGRLRLQMYENGWKAILYTYSDTEEKSTSQMLKCPEDAVGMNNIYLNTVEGWRCQDGSIGIAVKGYKDGNQVTYIYRMDQNGSETLAEPYVIEDGVTILALGNGAKAISNTLNWNDELAVYEIDFSDSPQVISAENHIHFPAEEFYVCLIDQNRYAIVNPSVCVNLYDEEDQLLYSISNADVDLGTIYSVAKSSDGIAVFHYMQEERAIESVVGISFFDANGTFIERKKLAIDTNEVSQWIARPVTWGHSLAAIMQDGSAVHYFLNQEFSVVSYMETSSLDGMIMGERFVFSGNSVNGALVSITESVLKEQEEANETDGENGTGGENETGGANGTNREDEQKKAPTTGDEANVLLYIVLCIAAAVAAKRKLV